MYRRFSIVVALVAFAASFMASDAQAAAAAPSTAETVGQAGPMPSLAPIVKQLRPVVVNVNSRFKPRKVAQRMPQRRMPQQPPDQDENDGSDEDQQDPMERFFRYFGG